MAETKNILVIRFSSMGEVVLTAPLFVALKQCFSESSIYLLTDSRFEELFKDNPYLSGVSGTLKNDWRALEKLKSIEWDLVVDLQRDKRSLLAVEALPYKKMTRFIDNVYFRELLQLWLRAGSFSDKNSIVYRYLKAAELNGEELPPARLIFNSPVPSEVRLMLESSGIIRPSVAIFPFSSRANKNWPMEYFIEVGSFFVVKGWNILIMGSPAKKEFCELLASYIGTHCYSLAGKLTLYECGTVLQHCDLALGNDTGLTHLARACGVKTGIIFGPTTHQFGLYPYGDPPFKIFESGLWCRPCSTRGGNICFFGKACVGKIRPETVIKELIELISLKPEIHS